LLKRGERKKSQESLSSRDELFEIGSTLSGNSFNNSRLRQKSYKTPSVFKQTQYLDRIEDILTKRKRQRKQKALAFLKHLELKKSEVLAENLLSQNLTQKQSQGAFEDQI